MDFTPTLVETSIASLAMLIIALAVYLIYLGSPGSKQSKPEGDKNEPYLGGEEQPYDKESIGSGKLFSSVANQSLRKVYGAIIDRFDTYSIHEWLAYMAVWFGFLVVLLIIMVVVL
jgi:hypothetical protein